MNDAELARNYILDRLSEEERNECERRFLFDPEFELLMIEQERELLDDYVNSRLSNEESDAVLRRVAQRPGELYRLRFAESLRRAAAAPSAPLPHKRSPIERWQAFFAQRRTLFAAGTAGIAVASAVIVIALAVRAPRSLRTQQNGAAAGAPAHANAQPSTRSEPKQQTASAPSQKPVQSAGRQIETRASSAVATFALLADEQRGAGDLPSLQLAPGVTTLRLQLTTQEGLEAGRYRVALNDAQGTKVYSASDLPALVEAGRRYVDLRIPAALVSSGDYHVDLAPESEASSQPELSFRFALTASPASASPQQ
jgi:hypothetical protein